MAGDASLEFKDKVVLITGASAGIGRRLALDMAERGAVVVGCGRSQERLVETLAAMKRHSPSSSVHLCDVGNAEQVKSMIQKVLSELGRIDILINNAGFGIYQSFNNSPLDSIEGIVRTNLLGAVYCIKEVLPSMIQRGSGHIVNISSVAGKIGTPNMASYCASKFALIGLSETLYHELRPLGIQVSVICPGPVRTKMRLLLDHLASGVWIPEFLILRTEAVSRSVIRSLEKRRFQVVLPFWLALVCFVKGLAPNLFQLLSYRVLRLRLERGMKEVHRDKSP